MKAVSNIVLSLIMATVLLVSCKNNDGSHRQDDTKAMETTAEGDPPTAFKDTVVTVPDSLHELQKAKGEESAQ